MIEKRKFSTTFNIYCIIILFFIFCMSIIFSKQSVNSLERASFHVESDIINVKNSLLRQSRQSLGFFEVTAYCPCELCCGEYADGITASGHIIRIGDRFCAADSIIPFGKYLDIPGYGYVPVLDRGGAIKGRKLDVFFNTHQEALEWGRKKLEIYCWVQQDD